MKNFKNLLIPASVLVLSMGSCKKEYLETKPSDAATEDQIFSRVSSVTAALQGLYKDQFSFGSYGSTGHDNFGQKSTDLQMDLMGNDMVVHSQGYGWFNTDYQLTAWGSAAAGSQSDYTWARYYSFIKQANKVISNIDKVTDATTVQKETYKGQAYGMRAYSYFYLINLYQQTYKGNETKPGVPIYLTGEELEGKSRGTVQQVYDQIIADLTKAETLLTGKTRTAKTDVDLSVVQGLRARTALIMNDWATAATYANKARQGYALMSTTTYTSTSAFSSLGTSEVMWGSAIPADQATIYASFFSHMDIRTGGYAALGGQKKITKALYDLIPTGDVRKTVFTVPTSTSTSDPAYNQKKMQVPVAGSWAADYIYMRVAEMYLIEAEALARQGQDAGARTVLETLVKARNAAYSAAAFSGVGLVDEILLQRRIELWGEGFSLMDIKRLNQGLNRPTGTGNHGAPSFNPGVLTTSPADPRFIMRIPQKELDNNTALTPADQNP